MAKAGPLDAVGLRLRLLFDRVFFRHPFEGASAERYARDARPAFDDFDQRLLDLIADRYGGLLARPPASLLEVGAGPGVFARAAAARFPRAAVFAVEPSRSLARAARAEARGVAGLSILRATAEQLPLAASSISLAVLLSSIRHVADRGRAFAELRRVLAPGGAVLIVELDPEAQAARVAHHARRLEGRLLRAAFGPLVVRTAPPWQRIAERAGAAGLSLVRKSDDARQPFYLLEFR